ncbi:hypothetical protein SO3561_04585 [Streptomyces olivochromogenes]|uniref:Uncharacterized protein n=1 Tax=Streptomyces olivochromogenes TaxID=1963 RepID=A0A250VGF7_STROL|nr:hypothetical protein SO3561_04585 [Streptomyces olivochromogenes]
MGLRPRPPQDYRPKPPPARAPDPRIGLNGLVLKRRTG